MPCQLTESPLTCVAVGSGPLAGGVRGDPPDEPQLPPPAPASGRPPSDVPQAGTPAPGGAGGADRALAGPALEPLLRGRERPAARDPARRLGGPRPRSARAPSARSSRPATWSTGSTRPSRPGARTRTLRDGGRRAARPASPRRESAVGRERAVREAARAATGSAALGGFEPVTARVIGRSPTVWFSTVTIDDGSSSGIERNDAVINGDGLVGRIREVTAGTAPGRADHRPTTTPSRPGSCPTGPTGIVAPGRRRPRGPAARLHRRRARRSPRTTSWSPPAGRTA